MYKKVVIILLVIIVALGAGTYWYLHRHQANLPASIRGQGASSEGQPVEVAKVQSKVMPNHLNTVGVLKSRMSVTISSEVAGKIVENAFTPGALVKKGQLLIQLDDQIYKANLQAAKAALTLSKATFERYKRLIDSAGTAKQQFDQVRSQFQQDQAKVSVNETMLRETRIVAPFDGYVGPEIVNVGDYVTPGQKLTSLVVRKLLRAVYSLPEKNLHQLALGQKVEVRTANHEDHPVEGKVTYISPSVDEATHSVEVQAEIPNADNYLAPGLFVNVAQYIGMPRHTLVVPEQAVVPTIDGSRVYKIVNGKAVAIDVKVGSAVHNWVPILKGLQEGDEIVVAGQQQLKDGSQIRVVSH